MSWSYIKSGMFGEHQIGPVSDREFVEAIENHVVKPKSLIAHPVYTGNKWKVARTLAVFRELYSSLMSVPKPDESTQAEPRPVDVDDSCPPDILFDCIACGENCCAPSQSAGKKFKCEECGNINLVPSEGPSQDPVNAHARKQVAASVASHSAFRDPNQSVKDAGTFATFFLFSIFALCCGCPLLKMGEFNGGGGGSSYTGGGSTYTPSSNSLHTSTDDRHYDAFRRDSEELGLDPDMQDEGDIRAANKILRDAGEW